jgi:hypothetical protein
MSKVYHSISTAHLVETLEIRKDPARANCYDIYVDGQRLAGVYGADGKPPKLKLALDEVVS